MGMERRWGVRKPVDVDAWIDLRPTSLLEGHISNISIGGLFFYTDPSTLRLNAPVELILQLDDDGESRIYRLPAVVVRLSVDGAGLMFDQYDVNAFRTLVVLLLERQKALASHRSGGGHRYSLPSRSNLAEATRIAAQSGTAA